MHVLWVVGQQHEQNYYEKSIPVWETPGVRVNVWAYMLAFPFVLGTTILTFQLLLFVIIDSLRDLRNRLESPSCREKSVIPL